MSVPGNSGKKGPGGAAGGSGNASSGGGISPNAGPGLGQRLTDLTGVVLGDISTGLAAAEQYGKYVANGNPSSVALASKLGSWGARLGGAGTVLSGALAMNAALDGDGLGATQYAIDTAVGGLAIFTGTVGFIGGAAYTAVRATGLGDYLGSAIADIPDYGPGP